MLAAFHCRSAGKSFRVDHRAVHDVTRHARFVAHVLAAHRRLHAVGADQRDAAVDVALAVVHRDALFVLVDALHRRRGQHLDAVGRLRAFEQRHVNVGAVDHRVRIAEALAESLAGLDAADQRLVERVVHHHLVGVDRAAAGLVANAQSVERREGVRAELDAGADLAELRRLLEHLDRETAPRQRKRCRQAADPTTCHQHRQLLLRSAHVFVS